MLKKLKVLLGNILKTQKAENEVNEVNEVKEKESAVMEDRHQEETPISSVSEDGRAEIFPRRYLLLAGAYLVTVVLLLSFVILRWGSVPSPEIPGVERDFSWQEADYEEGEDLAEKEVGEITSGLHPSENTVFPEGEGESEDELQESVETVQVEDALLMQAASPLSQWSLHHAYGSYVAETLPSGGKLHRLLNGAFFRGVPGASVAALWDGYVLTVGGEDSPCSPYVLLQHDGGFTTFYGNLSEVWVEEGSFISRGENLGLLPSLEDLLPVSARESAEEVPRKVSIRTIYRGIDGEITSAWNSGEWETDDYRAEPAMAAPTSFYGESPLFYLEVRQGNSYIDPLKFLHMRN